MAWATASEKIDLDTNDLWKEKSNEESISTHAYCSVSAYRWFLRLSMEVFVGGNKLENMDGSLQVTVVLESFLV